MPLIFNETVPTVTDLLEYAEFDKKLIRKIITSDDIYKFLSDAYAPVIPNTKPDIYLIDIREYINTLIDFKNSITEKQISKLKEFLSTTNSEYIAWM